MNLTISSPRVSSPLAQLGKIARAFYESPIHQNIGIDRVPDNRVFLDYLRDNVHQFISDNLKSPFKNYKRVSQDASIRNDSKRKGHQLSRAIASIKKNPKSIQYAYEYLSLIDQMSIELGLKFEPMYFRAQEYMRSNWQAITLRSIDSSIDFDLTNFNYYNKIYQVHYSIDEPSMVAYYPSLDHMRRGREVRLRFGKFLSNIKDEIGLTDESMLKKYVDSYNAMMQARQGWRMNFIESNDREGWLETYRDERHVRSCMSDCDSVKLYAHDHSILRLAYLTNDDDEILARTIVREDLKQYIRIYPPSDSSASAKWLKSLLIDQGYSWGNLNGCLIKTYDSKDDYDNFVYLAPYVDRGNDEGTQNAKIEKIDGKLYFRIDRHGDHCLSYTNGFDREVSDDDDSVYCEWCDDYHHPDDTRYHDNLGYNVCDSCSGEYGVWVYSHGDQILMHQDDSDFVYCESDSEYYDRDSLDYYDVIECSISGEYYLIDDVIRIGIDLFIHKSKAIALLFDHIEGGESFFYISIYDAYILPNGEIVNFDQYNEMIDRLNSFKLETESEAIYG